LIGEVVNRFERRGLRISGVEAVQVVRTMAGVTNGRQAAPGTIRGDYSVSNQQNIVHASDSVENAPLPPQLAISQRMHRQKRQYIWLFLI